MRRRRGRPAPGRDGHPGARRRARRRLHPEPPLPRRGQPRVRARRRWPCDCLLEGVRLGEKGLYVTLSETKAELAAVARSHGWSLDGIDVLELVAPESELEPDNQNAMFQPSEVELGVTTKAILAEVERTKPRRVVIDSLSEMRLLAQSPLRYRRQVLALKQYFIGRECTVFLLDDLTSETEDLQLQSIAHGVVSLEQLSPEYGAERRRLRVTKLRGQKYRGGYHDFVIATGRARRLPPARRRRARPRPEAGPAQVRQRGAGRPPGRGPAVRHQRGPHRPGRERQVHPRHPVRPGGGGPRRAGRGLRLRRAGGDHPGADRGPRDGHLRVRRVGPHHDPADRHGRAVARRVRPPRPPGRRGRGRQAGGEGRRHRQPERVPERHARGAVPHRPAPRAAHLPRAQGGGDVPPRRPARPGRPDGDARSIRPTSRTRSSCSATSRRWARCGRPSRSSRSGAASTSGPSAS